MQRWCHRGSTQQSLTRTFKTMKLTKTSSGFFLIIALSISTASSLPHRAHDPAEKGLQFTLLPFSVAQPQAEEMSDEEWAQMLTKDLQRHGVLGQIIDRVPPYVINVDYGGDDGCVHLGNEIPPMHSRLPPVQLNYATNGSGGLFTLMAIDPDVPLTSRNRINSTNGLYSEFLQWLVVNIPEEDVQKGQVLAEYLGPLPSARDGGKAHRFVFLVYRQTDVIDPAGRFPRAEPCDWSSRARFSASRFAQLHRLGHPVAVNYFLTRFDPSVPLSIEQCLLRRQSRLHIHHHRSPPMYS